MKRAPDESLVLDIRRALRHSGSVRPLQALDILIAGHAIVNDTTIRTADHDSDYTAAVADLQREDVAPSA